MRPVRALSLAVLLLPAGLAAPPAAAAFDLPAIDPIVRYQPKLPLQVLTADGVEIAQFGAERRIYTPLARIPRRLVDAVLAVEDTRFREHGDTAVTQSAPAPSSVVAGIHHEQ